MTMTRTTAENQRTRPKRWIALLLASVLLHVVAFNWATGRLVFPSLHQEKPVTVTAALLPVPVPPAPVPKPAPPPKAKRKRPPVHQPAPQPVSEPAAETVSTLPPVAQATDTGAEPAAGTADAAAAPVAVAEEGTAEEKKEAARYKISLPPSADLQYDVQALRNGQNWYGSGVFQWEATEHSYRINGEASVTIIFKIGVLNFKSEGVINEFGIAPVLYSEKPWRKPLKNTHFQHAERKISFSASEASYPYNGGEQDRASIIWQLAGIGRGDASQFAPGAEIDVFVAGTRNAEAWHISVIGEEEIDTPYGKLAAWHVVRAPRAGSHDQRIDIWLAPQQQWYPARVRYTYANGDHLEMSLSGIAPPAAAR